MWFFGKNLLERLVDENVSLEKREKLFKRSKLKFISDIKEVSEELLLDYLFKSKLPDVCKDAIYEEILRLQKDKYNSSSKDKYERIKNVFYDKYAYEGLLKSKYCFDEFKALVVDKVYGDDFTKALTKGNVSLSKKKLIVDLKVSESDVESLLELNLNDELIDYIISTKLSYTWRIRDCLDSEKIPLAVREKVALKCINKGNFFDIYNKYSKNGIDLLSFRRDIIDEMFDSTNEDDILEYFCHHSVPKEFIDKLLFDKKDVIESAIKNADVGRLSKILVGAFHIDITNQIFEHRKDACYQIIKSLKPRDAVHYINQIFLSSEFKEAIYKERKDDILKVIKGEAFDVVMMYYLRETCGMPVYAQKDIVNLFYDDVYKLVMSYRDDEIKDQLMYKCHCPEIAKLIVNLRCDDKTAFKLLSSVTGGHRIAGYILEGKKDAISRHLMSLKGKDLFLLNGLCITSDIAERIIFDNKDYLLEEIKKLDEKTKYELLTNEKVSAPFKQMILGNFGIEGLDISECLMLLNEGNAKVLIEHFKEIKKYITDCGVDFNSLLQYGAGSKKHPSWLAQLANIVMDGKGEDFNTCRKYFINNYYDRLNEKENAVLSIESFLEIVDNYSKYRELIESLSFNNTKLSEKDKLDLRFLFGVSVPEGVDVPKNLSELSAFKSKLYSGYIKMINDDDLDEDFLKQIFNDLIFGDSQILLQSIGGTGALRTLKKDNSNSLEIANLVDEVTLYASVIEMVNNTNNCEGLKKILRYVFSDIDTLTKFQNLFFEFEDKLNRLYEADSKYNLTSLDEARRLGCIDKVLSEKYGGEVFNFSDKNYVLYAHVLSSRENPSDLLSGASSGDRNFISVSPVSYRGQNYYFGKDGFIFAYDKIPNGSFVRSSISNMGSNGLISKNSYEVAGKGHGRQRGILECSSSTGDNPEALLYREGLKACGLILPGGRTPTASELEFHRKYNVPFIITQEAYQAIDDVKMIFKNDVVGSKRDVSNSVLEEIINILKPNVSISKEDDEFTGREVAIFTDCHSMYEPTLAVLEDIKRCGITEIYSLGDNVGLGPNPCEVFDLLEEYGVVSVAGNSEYYSTLGIEPFPYFYEAKKRSQEWTAGKLGKERIKKMEVYPASIDLVLGGERLALCHFANDVRWDFHDHSTHTYQADFESGHAAEQFLYTNSDECKKKVSNCITSKKKGDKSARGYISSKESPLFDGKMVTDYDAIIQGHVHFDMEDEIEGTSIHTLRAVGMGHKKERVDTACYYVFREKKDGSFVKEKRNVTFNRDNMMASIHNSDLPNKEAILRYVK